MKDKIFACFNSFKDELVLIPGDNIAEIRFIPKQKVHDNNSIAHYLELHIKTKDSNKSEYILNTSGLIKQYDENEEDMDQLYGEKIDIVAWIEEELRNKTFIQLGNDFESGEYDGSYSRSYRNLISRKLNTCIEDIENLSSRTKNALKNAGIKYIGEIVTTRNLERILLSMPNFGKKSVNELKEFLSIENLSFNMNPGSWGDNIKKHLERNNNENN